MKILSLEVKGFRSLYDTTWEPGDLNIVIGPNASGKSNLLRILEMLSVSARGGLADHIRTEGGMEPILWDGSADAIKIQLKTSPLDPSRDVQGYSLTYQLELERLGKRSTYRIRRELQIGRAHV